MSLPALRRVRSWLAVLACLALMPAAARSANPFVRTWWLNEARTPVQVNDMLRDPSGVVWLATDAGIFRFNGAGFAPVRDSGGAVTCLFYNSDGLLAGYRSGRIARVRADSVCTIPVNGGPGAAVTSFATWGDVIAFGTLGEGIWALHRGSVSRFGAAQGLSDDYVYALAIPEAGSLLAATDRGLDLIRAGPGRPRVEKVLAAGIVQCLRALPGAPGRVLAGTAEGRLVAYDFDGGRRRLLHDEHFPSPILDLCVLNGRILALQGNNRVLSLERSPGEPGFRRCDSFSLPEPGTRLIADAAGRVYCGSRSGLHTISYGYLLKQPAGPGFRLGGVSAMASRAGTRWYGQADSLVRIDRGGATGVMRIPAQITSLVADSARLWIGTLGHGLLFLDAAGSMRIPAGAEGLAREHVLSLSIHRDHLWISTLSGLDEFEIAGDRLVPVRHHSKQGGLGADYVYQCVPDHLGRMWIATDGAGICLYENGRYRRWTDGQDGFRGRTIYSITEDAQGRIWAATLEHGICRFDGRRWTPVGRAEGLHSLNVSTLATLGDGQVLAVHDQGLDLWQPANGAFRHIGRRQGLQIDSSSRTLNCVATDGGRAAVPFEEGFLELVPRDQYLAVNPALRLTAVSVPGKPGSLGQRRFAPTENTLAFRFEGANMLDGERLHYRYRLDGFMKDWIMTRDESATFAGLPAGSYRFEVQAAYSAAFTNPASARFDFQIARPIWFRWWFLACAGLLLLIGTIAVIRLRERNIRRIEQLQKARIQMEYEHLKSQINPHFLFNSLNILGTLISRDPGRAVDYTYALSDLYRNTLHYRDRELIPLEEEWSILEQYLLVQKTRFGEALSLERDIPEETMRAARIVPLALQLLVENAIKHNVVSRSAPLVVRIEADGDLLRVSNPFRPKRDAEKGTGIGLANIRSRYSLHHRDIRFGRDGDTFTVELPLL